MNNMLSEEPDQLGRVDLADPSVPVIRVVDRPCGSGKTNSLLTSFKGDEKYLVIVPLLSEVERVIRGANVPFVQPMDDLSKDGLPTKSDHLRRLLCEGANVVTTHKLYSIIVDMVHDQLLSDYHIVIDEVPDVCWSFPGKQPKSWEDVYVGGGYATVDPDTGLVSPTSKWHGDYALVADTIDPKVYHHAKSGCLFLINEQWFVLAMPKALLTAGLSMTFYTFKAEGSLLTAYLTKLGIPYIHDTDPAAEAAFKAQARGLVTIRTLPLLERIALSYNGQDKGANARLVSGTLKKLRERPLRDVPQDHIMVTCRKTNWYMNGNSEPGREKAGPYSAGSRMFKSIRWVANTTRGTNDHVSCTHLIYLWDQRINPNIARWLGLTGHQFEDQYALTELIQWAWRSRVRRGEPIVLYLPSKRMRAIFQSGLNS